MTSPSRSLIAGTTLALAASMSHAAVGTKVILQTWQPWNDNRQPSVVAIDDPQFVSGPIMRGWNTIREPLCAMITSVLGTPDMVHPGITFYNTRCELNPLDVSITPIAPNRAKIVVSLARSRVVATATTPNLRQLGVKLPVIGGIGVGGGVDPRFSIATDAQFELDVEIGDAPRPFLTVHRAHYDLRRADARGENITGKIGEFVASRVIPFFGGPNFERRIEQKIESFRGELAGRAAQWLAPVNARIAGYAQYVRVATWMSHSRIAMAMQPRELPVIRLGGQMTGIVASPARALDCSGFAVRAEYQVAPAPILDPDTLALGAAKRVAVGTPAVVQARSDGGCDFVLRGLALGITNYVHASHPLELIRARGGDSSRLYASGGTLVPSGWDGSRVNPQPVASNRNYVMRASAPGSVQAIRHALGVPDPGIPIVQESPTVLTRGGSAGARALRSLGGS